MASSLRLHRRAGVTRIELAHENDIPRVTSALLEELRSTLRNLWADANCRALVIHGSEKCFAAGAEISEVGSLAASDALPFARRGQLTFEAIATSPKPVVAAITGYCMGGAWDLALACWWRLATPDAIFGHPGATLGILTGWGGTQRLPGLIGRSRTLELLTQGTTLTAGQAHRLGVVDEIVSPDALVESAIQRAAVLAGRLAERGKEGRRFL